MPRLARAQQQAQTSIRDYAASGLPPERLAARMMSAIRSAIPCDGFRMFGIDPRTLLVNRVLASSENDVDPRHEWLREVYLKSGPLTYLDFPEIMRAGLTAVAFQDEQRLCFGYDAALMQAVHPAKHHELFHELRSPVGGTLFGCFPARGQWVAAMQMYRRDDAPPFRAGEVAFLRLMAPAIGEAILASLGREQALAPVTNAPDASGIVLLNEAGAVTFATPAGENWISVLNDSGMSGHAPMASAIWSARASLLSGRSPGGAHALVATTSVGPVRVEASQAGADGSVAVVVSAARPLEPLELPIYWPLTGREREIATLAIRGFDSTQIADRVFLSTSTVDWHLSNVYEKLEVDGKSGLYARFFRELMLPEFDRESVDR